MKVFVSADIEGTNGIANWGEAEKHPVFNKRMTLEVAAVCEGINGHDPGAEILVKDAHYHGDNIDHELLPRNAMLNKGFSGHPLNMMNLLDESFDASILTGYHSPAGSEGNILAHSMSRKFGRILINGELASEFHFAYYTSLRFGVPMAMVAGDGYLARQAKAADGDILTVATLEGFGASATSPHPEKTRQELRETAKQAAANAFQLKAKCAAKLPQAFDIEILYHDNHRAFRAAHYPGASAKGARAIRYEAKDFMEILRLIIFV